MFNNEIKIFKRSIIRFFVILSTVFISLNLMFISQDVLIVNADTGDPSDGAIDFEISPSTAQYEVGDTISITIRVVSEDSSHDLSALGINLIYDSSRLQYVSYTAEQTDVLSWQSASVGSGSFKISAGLVDSGTPFTVGTTAVDILKIDFEVIGSGDAYVYFSYSADRNQYDNYTAAVLVGDDTDSSDHDSFSSSNPAQYIITSTDDYNYTPPSTGIFDWPLMGIAAFLLGFFIYVFKLPFKLKNWYKCIYKN